MTSFGMPCGVFLSSQSLTCLRARSKSVGLAPVTIGANFSFGNLGFVSQPTVTFGKYGIPSDFFLSHRAVAIPIHSRYVRFGSAFCILSYVPSFQLYTVVESMPILSASSFEISLVVMTCAPPRPVSAARFFR